MQTRWKNPDWFSVDGEDAVKAHAKFMELRQKRFVENEHQVFLRGLLDKTVPYLIGEGKDPTMPGSF